MNQQELDTRFEFRTIEPEEIEEAIAIEQICFHRMRPARQKLCGQG